MTTPKEALELKPCPFCNGSATIERYGNASYSTIYTCDECGCRLETGEEFNHGSCWNTRATASLEGDAVERVARIVVAWADAEELEFTIRQIDRLVRAVLATGLVPDEAAVRADEREKCAKVAEEHSFELDIVWWLGATKKDVSAETCRSIASAIRSGGGE